MSSTFNQLMYSSFQNWEKAIAPPSSGVKGAIANAFTFLLSSKKFLGIHSYKLHLFSRDEERRSSDAYA
ncbi:hypothetical protein FNW02_29265 [Komarekiella sp. 'clone 1']|uniref:Uncharacterized protein n=1 Tax=Komarekiella delphini-convector SJRDD-AB1 TaxID=2593771 RepID=A0AA40T2N4_9NOST|nr:hypothetical protein [Komarekiella delphini-convector]MBD6619789.1 hypothetical protein [Komarekiella delphini-convector SJRDD-AB1]